MAARNGDGEQGLQGKGRIFMLRAIGCIVVVVAILALLFLFGLLDALF